MKQQYNKLQFINDKQINETTKQQQLINNFINISNKLIIQWINDCLVVYIEKNVVCSIDNETIIQQFQNMKTRRRQL